MPNIFICLENPASVIGEKGGNRRPGKTGKASKLTTKEISAKERLWATRKAFLEDDRIDVDAEYDSSRDAEVRFVGELASAKKYIQWASTGSLRTMLIELKSASVKHRISFDTIVFMGHGGPGCMSTGNGIVGNLPAQFNDKKLRIGAEAYDQDKRQIDIGNALTWGSKFGEITANLATGARGRLHIFLLGCSTGETYLGTTLQATVAATVSQQCNLPVAAYGTDNDIKIEDTKEVIDNLNTIEGAAATGATYTLKASGTNILCSCS